MTHAAPNLGNIIDRPRWRKVVYGTYAIGALIVGGVAVYFTATVGDLPQIVVGAQAVIAYLAIPVGGLALANTPASQ